MHTHQPEEAFLEIDGLRVFFRAEGVGRPVVLVHGWPTHSFLWRHVIAALRETHRCYALDLPGFGRSEKPEDAPYTFTFFSRIIEGFVEQLSLERVDLVVHDIGGPSGILYADRCPERVGRLVVLNSPIYPMRTPLDAVAHVVLLTPLLRNAMVSPWGLKRVFKSGVRHKRKMTPEVIAKYQAPFRDPATRGVLRKTILAPMTSPNELPDLSQTIARLRMPVSLVIAQRDLLCGAHMRRLAEELPQLPVHSLPEAGHYLQEDMPEELAAIVAKLMMANAKRRLLDEVPVWSMVVPVVACGALALVWGGSSSWVLLLVAAAAIVAAVLVAVYHAEVIAHRVGEPFGTLVLALAVTLIEVSLIVSMMMSDHVDSSNLARDAVFATVMIVCNGVIGLCLLVGALKHHELSFRVEGTTPSLSVLATLATMSLVLPDFTFSTEGPTFSRSQLVFAGVVSLVLYGVFLFVQTIRHREFFLADSHDKHDDHGEPPTVRAAWASLILLMVSLVAVVGLAESMAPAIESAIDDAGMPQAVVGIAIALLVLLPETTAAVRAARANRMQTSFNLALGSALATIGLTIPAIAFMSIALGLSINLGLPPKEITLFVLTLLLSSMTLSNGRATILQGTVHLVVFAVFIFMAMVP
ncbi:Putative ionic transporter y4hA [Durusdinium trenchii]|uniref:Ionic transporter y4hA n=1 Tax=Durusdinium trenchii TaxID=1381693 RepID=A0ABP0RIJ9_9DINO